MPLSLSACCTSRISDEFAELEPLDAPDDCNDAPCDAPLFEALGELELE
jgi:hypothetical protein